MYSRFNVLMMQSMALLVMTLSAALAAPALVPGAPLVDEEYPLGDRREFPEQVIVPQKRAALVLDRLLIALQKALHEESVGQRLRAQREGPRTSALRLANFENDDVVTLNYKPGLQRRDEITTRGRVVPCYFNAITCF